KTSGEARPTFASWRVPLLAATYNSSPTRVKLRTRCVIQRTRSRRGEAATKKNRNISRKDAKAQSKKRFPNLAFLASWREGYPNPRVSRCEKFARLAQILVVGSKKIEM